MWAIATAVVFAVFRRAEGSLRAGPGDGAAADSGAQFRGGSSHLEQAGAIQLDTSGLVIRADKDGRDGKDSLNTTELRRHDNSGLDSLYGSMYSNLYNADTYYHVPTGEPDCSNCVTKFEEATDDGQCCVGLPSDLNMCSRFIPDSVIAYINDSSITSTWRDWDNSQYVYCPTFNNSRQGITGIAKCDPCKRGNAFDEDETMYCQYIDGQQVCYEATPSQFRIPCLPSSATNWYGGWNIASMSRSDIKKLKCRSGTSHCDTHEDCANGKYCDTSDDTVNFGMCTYCDEEETFQGKCDGTADSGEDYCSESGTTNKLSCQKCGYCTGGGDAEANP